MEDQNFRKLLERYNSGESTPEENQALEAWYASINQPNQKCLSDDSLPAAAYSNWEVVQANTNKFNNYQWLRVAAALFILFTIGLSVYIWKGKIARPESITKRTEKIVPGGNKAYLTLANGSRISLNDIGIGKLASESGIQITKQADGEIVYAVQEQVEGNQESEAIAYNTIETPNGGHYTVILPDGTKVWLNAASALKYPTTFANTTNREVELSGEAYFEVAHDASKPFRVATPANQQHSRPHVVEVLGTHFNINAYADEPSIITTLLQGSVMVNQQLLKPGYQSVFKHNKIAIEPADVEAAVGWKNGNFVFTGQDAATMLRMLGRWYDVEIDGYELLNDMHFGGIVSRSRNLSEVINMLQKTGDLKFKVEGRRIIMMK